jgi:hypothetical protein
MLLSDILNGVSAAATALSPMFPPAALVSIGAGLAKSIADAVHQHQLDVKDANGDTVDPGPLSVVVADHFNAALGLTRDGVTVADAELAALAAKGGAPTP